MQTLDDIQQLRDALKRKLQAAYEAALARGETVLVSQAELDRLEELCAPGPVRHAAAPRKSEWVRC
jgi:hypothetical protein